MTVLDRSLACRPERGRRCASLARAVRWLGAGLAILGFASAYAQDPQPGGKPPAPAPTSGEGDLEKAAVDTRATRAAGLEERYKDPRVDAALVNTFPELFPNVHKTIKTEHDRIIASARQPGGDTKSLSTYIRAQIAQLTLHRNIDAMLQPAGTPDANQSVSALEEAGANLLTPLAEANAADNAGFRSEFTKALVKDAAEVMKNHLYARLMVMVALSRSQDPAALDFLVKQLSDPTQVLPVKLLAAVGLSNIAGKGKTDVVPADAARATAALIGFLTSEKDSFWPARLRAVEALGALRQAETTVRSPKADVADALLTVLSDPEERPEVRSEAAWSLGMLRINPQVTKFNFALVAYHMGRAAADIAERAIEDSKASDARALRMADALLQICWGFEGDTAIRGAGLLRNEHASLTSSRAPARSIAERVKAVASAAVELGNAPKARKDAARDTLSSRIEELRSTLAKVQPSDLSLYPDGPRFPDEGPDAPAPDGERAGRSD